MSAGRSGGSGSPVAGGRKRGIQHILWIALISVSGLLVLAGANRALRPTVGERAPRLLLQGQRSAGGRRAAAGDGALNPQQLADADEEADAGSRAGSKGGSVQQTAVSAQAAASRTGGSGSSNGGGKKAAGKPDAEAKPAQAVAKAAAAAAAGDEGGEEDEAVAATPAADGPGERLGPDSDLASFAANGTECVITPSHGKVALLFLTHGDLPHDELWGAWLREARGLLPRAGLAGDKAFCLKQCDAEEAGCRQRCGRAAACNPLCLRALSAQMGPERSSSVLQQQHLFSVYVHARPTLKDYKEGSVFAGRLIPDRIIAKPGAPSMAAAAKKLVEAAVLDARNEWFVLVGDTTVPLYHPTMVWQQLMHEKRSRVDACWHKEPYLQRKRYTPAFSSQRFQPGKHWRRSSQWFVLNRKHAELLAHDQEVASLFGKHCSVGFDEKENRFRDCVADQHYVPSLLAMHGLDKETTCDGSGGTAWAWDPVNSTVAVPGSKPVRLFQPGNVTPELVASLRQTVRRAPDEVKDPEQTGARLCGSWAGAAQAAREGFIDASGMMAGDCAASLGSRDFLLDDLYQGVALHPRCPLMARKFSQHASKWVHRLYRSCTAQLGVLECSQRLTDRDNNWWS